MGNDVLRCGGAELELELGCGRTGTCSRPSRSARGGPGEAIDLAPEPLCKRGGCGRAFGYTPDDGASRCDPAGAVFDATVRHLGDLDQAALQFAGSGNVAAMRWLLHLGASPAARDSNGTTLLHAACRAGSLEMVRELVKRGLALDVGDHAGWTPLHVASCMGRQDVTLCLLQAGAGARVKNARGQTPEELCSHPSTKEVILGYHVQPRGGGSGSSHSGGQGRSAGGVRDAHYGGNGKGGSTGLRFEPCFVPREAALRESSRHVTGRDVPKDLKEIAVDIFNRSPGHGVAFLVAAGIVRDYPVEINGFLNANAVDPEKFGDYIGADYPLAQNLRLELLNSMPFLGTGAVGALETAFRNIAVPSDLQRASRIVRSVAHFWWLQHEEELQAKCDDLSGPPRALLGGRAAAASAVVALSTDVPPEVTGAELQRGVSSEETLHGLMFSALMLYQWFRKGRSMTLNEWSQMNAGIEVGGGDVSMHVQTGAYQLLASGRRFRSEAAAAAAARRAPVVALTEGHAYVHYDGRAQVSHNGIPADFPSQRPRLLAARGGVASAGRSSCARWDDYRYGKSREDPDAGVGEERAWLSLHRSLLFFSPAPGLAEEPPEAVKQVGRPPPYAFISLQRAVLRVVDGPGMRLVLASRADPRPSLSSSPGGGCDEWLDLCLLLADGRFQPLEAPRLQLRFDEAASFELWKALLSEACAEPSRGQAQPPPSAAAGIGPRISSDSRPPPHHEDGGAERTSL